MKRLRGLAGILVFSVAAARGSTGSDAKAAPEGTGRHLVSLVRGCVEVPSDLHSFKTADLRDAFAGTIAAGSGGAVLLSWSTGMWDFKSFLHEFDPSEPPPEGAARVREGMWRARRGDSEFIVLRSGWGLLYGEVRDEANAVELRKVLSSYRQGAEQCGDAERPLAPAE